MKKRLISINIMAESYPIGTLSLTAQPKLAFIQADHLFTWHLSESF